jgi:two-component system response regulator YesN
MVTFFSISVFRERLQALMSAKRGVYAGVDREIIDAFFVFVFKKIFEALSEPKELSQKNSISKPSYVSDVVRAKRIDDYMYDHYKEDVSIEDLAAHIHLSTRQTSRFLKNYIGKSFNDYIAGYRIELAKKLLQNPDISADKVAFEVGYNSYNGFAEAFRKITGMRPKQYAGKKK